MARFNHPACTAKYVRIAEAMDVDVRGLLNTKQRRAVDAIGKLCADVNVAKKLKAFGCTEEDLEPIADDC